MAHTLHVVAPLDEAYEPATQFVQEAAPGEAEKVPGLHRLQLLDPGAAKEPAGQQTNAPMRRKKSIVTLVNNDVDIYS